MADKKPSKSGQTEAERREQRLKQALKANMGRRKAQARARGAATTHDAPDRDASGGQEKDS